MTPESESYRPGLRRAFIGGASVLALFSGTVGLWAAAAPWAGAVVASGQFVVDSNLKKVQHQTGGIVAELNIREGTRVKAGDIVMRLDDTLLRANLQIVVTQLDELQSRQARLEAEREGRDDFILAPGLKERESIPAVRKSLADEKRLMLTRRSQRDGQRAQLTKRVAQLREEITGIDAQLSSREAQIGLLERELGGVRDLFERKLLPITRLMPLEREAASQTGQRGQLIASRAQAEGKIAETELQLLQIDIDMQTEIAKELREIQGRTSELFERKVAAEDQLKRTDIRAPIDGQVHQLAVHTVGGVIPPTEPVMLIVPQNEDLHIEIRVQPTDIDQLHMNQAAIVKVMAGNHRTTPEIAGFVSRLSSDVSRDPQTGMPFYLVRITTSQKERARLEGLTIISGMQAEVYIHTTDRTPFQYMIKPLKDQFNRAFRER